MKVVGEGADGVQHALRIPPGLVLDALAFDGALPQQIVQVDRKIAGHAFTTGFLSLPDLRTSLTLRGLIAFGPDPVQEDGRGFVAWVLRNEPSTKCSLQDGMTQRLRCAQMILDLSVDSVDSGRP